MKSINWNWIVLIIVILLVGTASASMDKNFVKDETTSKYGKVSLTDCGFLGTSCWLGGKGTLKADLELTENTETCGSSCYAIKTIKLYESGALIDDIRFYKLEEDKQILSSIRSYKFYIQTKVNQIEVDDYAWTCEKTGKKITNSTAINVDEEICSNKKVGSHFINSSEWTSYTVGEIKPAGTYVVKLEGNKNPKFAYDWQVKSQGEWITDWAVWGTTYVYDALTDGIKNASLWEDFFIGDGGHTEHREENVGNVSAWGCWGTGPTYNTAKTGWNATAFPLPVSNITLRFRGYIDDNLCSNQGGAVLEVYGYKLFIFKGYQGGGLNGSTNWENNSNWTIKYNRVTSKYDAYIGTSLIDSFSPVGTNTSIIAYVTNTESGIGSSGGCPGGTGQCGLAEMGVISYALDFITINVTLNFPVQNYVSSSQSVIFNCPVNITQEASGSGIYISNMSLWTNSTGSWTKAITNTTLGGGNQTLFNFSITQPTLWTCEACDTDGFCQLSSTNRTVSSDIINPSVSVTSPTGTYNYGKINSTLTLNFTATDTGLSSCWFEYNGVNTTRGCSSGVLNSSLFNQSTFDKLSLKVWANDTAGNLGSATTSWAYTIFENSLTYNTSTYDTMTESFLANATGMTTATLNYAGTDYAATVSSGIATKSISIPSVSVATNKTFYWTYNGGIANSSMYNQTVNPINFQICNATYPVTYINFTFKDEATDAAINGSIDSSTWYYYLVNSADQKTYLYTNLSVNEKNYPFCFSPPDRTINYDVNLQYSFTGYPQRRYNKISTLTNATTQQVLYLLGSSDGLYSRYIVQTSSGGAVTGVDVTVERQFAGVWTIVEQGITDSSGTVTFWLNPNFDHRLSFAKSGYSSVQVTIRPSASDYTVVMSTGSGAAYFNNSLEGMNWLINPPRGQLNPNTAYTFGLNITASKSNLVICKMEIWNSTTLLSSTTGCSASGGNLSLTVNVGSDYKINGKYYVDIGSGYYAIETDAYWPLIANNISDYTIYNFLTNIKGLDDSFFGTGCGTGALGAHACRAEYSRILLFFFLLFLIFGMISFTTGWDFGSAGGLLLILAPIVWFVSIAGWLRVDFALLNIEFLKKYLIAIIATLITGGYAFNTMVKS